MPLTVDLSSLPVKAMVTIPVKAMVTIGKAKSRKVDGVPCKLRSVTWLVRVSLLSSLTPPRQM